ncbi:NAD-dependent epimerase/dehydratase family protein [Pelagicoccus sp. SDUM812002]|uniref:NAD-dependent epimerase/dehydratase family protein n=1 Tax=Pelagicoccus sp. SDUM812002 TaxID=3041266 RepID=UPI00280D8596|nr:NAD-dependent epimerase/dehydratase family protein [Pelagicoccus sp. SDUM812002]MDQ8186853.1 NAD-dependent epimerase/dehydratase family protein [Pelagicoccus sp. SDUM812002]
MLAGKGKRLLVLGCGYLGRLLVADALRRGMRVLAVTRNLDTLAEVAKMGAETVCGLVDTDAWHEAAGSDVDFVVNCVSSAGGGLAGYRQSYIGGNESLRKWARSVGFAGRAIYTSSVSVYGDAGGAWVDECSAPEPANERGALVRQSEQVFLRGLRGAQATVLRLAGLYGPGRHLMLDRLRSGEDELAGWGDYYLNLVRIEDVVRSIWSCLEAESPVEGTFTVVDDEPELKQEIACWIAEAVGNPTPRFTGEADTSGRASRRLGENGRPANRRISNAALKKAVGWNPRFPSFREGFGDLLKEG